MSKVLLIVFTVATFVGFAYTAHADIVQSSAVWFPPGNDDGVTLPARQHPPQELCSEPVCRAYFACTELECEAVQCDPGSSRELCTPGAGYSRAVWRWNRADARYAVTGIEVVAIDADFARIAEIEWQQATEAAIAARVRTAAATKALWEECQRDWKCSVLRSEEPRGLLAQAARTGSLLAIYAAEQARSNAESFVFIVAGVFRSMDRAMLDERDRRRASGDYVGAFLAPTAVMLADPLIVAQASTRSSMAALRDALNAEKRATERLRSLAAATGHQVLAGVALGGALSGVRSAFRAGKGDIARLQTISVTGGRSMVVPLPDMTRNRLFSIGSGMKGKGPDPARALDKRLLEHHQVMGLQPGQFRLMSMADEVHSHLRDRVAALGKAKEDASFLHAQLTELNRRLDDMFPADMAACAEQRALLHVRRNKQVQESMARVRPRVEPSRQSYLDPADPHELLAWQARRHRAQGGAGTGIERWHSAVANALDAHLVKMAPDKIHGVIAPYARTAYHRWQYLWKSQRNAFFEDKMALKTVKGPAWIGEGVDTFPLVTPETFSANSRARAVREALGKMYGVTRTRLTQQAKAIAPSPEAARLTNVTDEQEIWAVVMADLTEIAERAGHDLAAYGTLTKRRGLAVVTDEEELLMRIKSSALAWRDLAHEARQLGLSQTDLNNPSPILLGAISGLAKYFEKNFLFQ